MANIVLKECKLYWEGYDFSGKMHTLSLPVAQTALPANVFGISSNVYLPGMKSFEFSAGGYHDNATVLDPDKYIEAEMSSSDTIVTVCPTDGAEGEPAYSMKANTTSYTPVDGGVGAVAGFDFSAQGTGKIIRGLIMQNGQETISGSGTAREIKGLDEGDVAYVTVHCTELDATSLQVIIRSDVDTGMGTPTTRDFGLVTFTAIGAQWGTYTAGAGISADDCWDVTFVLTGGNTTATFVVNLFIP